MGKNTKRAFPQRKIKTLEKNQLTHSLFQSILPAVADGWSTHYGRFWILVQTKGTLVPIDKEVTVLGQYVEEEN